jgi:hypothetical protein
VISHYSEKKNKYLRSAALTVAVLVFFVVGISLATLFRLLLSGLIVRLALSGVATLTALTGLLPALLAFFVLVTLLTFFELITLLTLLLHIVCHELPSWESAGLPTPSRFVSVHELVAAGDCKGWEGIRSAADLSRTS